ncbi:MAG: pseudouridine synthase [Pseudomonadota bacterium]
MAERRETGRPKRPARPKRSAKRTASPGQNNRNSDGPGLSGPNDASAKRAGPKGAGRRKLGGKSGPQKAADWSEGERIAKYLARAGVGSRRACETLIEAGKVTVNGERLHSPAVKVTGREFIKVGRKVIQPPEPTRLWRYHKPAGLITTTADPAGRSTIFSQLPKELPRVVTIGRLDLNTEGLLLLTNDGELARALELPKHAFERRYRARAYGHVDDRKLEELKGGITVDGERFGAIHAVIDQETGANNWLTVSLTEGRKREVRRALDAVGLKVNRLIRVQYGPFVLDDLKPGAVAEIPTDLLHDTIGAIIPGLELARGEPADKKPRKRPPTSRFRKRR